MTAKKKFMKKTKAKIKSLKKYTSSRTSKELGTDQYVKKEIYNDKQVFNIANKALNAPSQPDEKKQSRMEKLLKKKKKRKIVGTTVLDVVKKTNKLKPSRKKFKTHIRKYHNNTYTEGE